MTKPRQLAAIDAPPNYRLIADRLRTEILPALEPGERLASHHQLSRRFGVSRVTVRQALVLLQKSGHVQVIAKRGTFLSNRAGRLRRIRHGLIALLVENFQDPFFNELTQHIDSELRRNNLLVILCDTAAEPTGINYIDLLKDRVDGFLIGPSLHESSWAQYRLLSALGVPYVFFDRDIRSVTGDRVLVDNYLGGRLAASHLLEMGHRTFAVLTYTWPKKMLQAANEVMVMRVRGFRERLLESGIPESGIATVAGPGGRTKEAGALAAVQWLALDARPTGIFATNDILALGAMEAAAGHGLHMPRDFSLIGFDDINLVRWLDIPLSTIVQPKEEIAQHSVQLLLAQFDEKPREHSRHVLLQPKLTVRNSTGPAPAARP